MSSGCGDVLSLTDLQTAKKHQIFEAEVITGLQGGVAGGAPIDYATNQVTGQTQKTLPAILRDAGFRPASFTFVTGGTLNAGDSDMAVLWPVSGGGDGQYYIWKGAYPKVIPAGSSPASTGGVSASGWLPLGDITLRSDLASSAAGEGASLVKLTTGDTVQSAISTLKSNVAHGFINVKDKGAGGAGTTDDTAAITAAIASASAFGGTVYFPAGVYLVSAALDLKLKKCKLLGDGFNQSIIRASVAMPVLVDNQQASVDYGFNEFSMEGLQFDGNNLANVVFRVKNRNYATYTNCAFFNATQYAVQCEINISNSFYGCAFGNAPVTLALLGSNHRNSFRSCTFVGATNTFIQIIDGTDGNSALQFSNCDIEYQNGTNQVTGIYARVSGQVSLTDCYIGEGIRGTILYLEGSGALNVKGGLVVFGEYNEANSFMTRVDGSGDISFSDVDLNGGTYASITKIGSGFGTKVAYEHCRFNFSTLGNQPLYGVGGGLAGGTSPAIVPFYGRGWNLNQNGGTAQRDYSGTDQKITVFATTTVMSMYAAVDASKLSVGLGASSRYSYVLVTYQSDVALSARFTSTNLGSPVTDLGTLPAYPGGFVTYVIPCDIAAAATILEFDIPATATGTKFTLRDCTILDASYATNTAGKLLNLHKAV